jgi:uncharacterized protein (DUF169 family)
MLDLAAIAENLTSALKLDNPPVAVQFADALPAGIPAPSRRLPAGCSFWQEGTHAAVATTASDHDSCAIGIHTHNLEPSPAQQVDLQDALKVFASLGYVRPEDLPLIPVLNKRPAVVVYAPLAQSADTPDVVLLFVNANQALIVVEAAQQVEGGFALALGRPACAVVAHAANTGRAALSLGCCGARAYLNLLNDGTSVFALPGANLAAYTDRIQVLAAANSTLGAFHEIRLKDVEAGLNPTVQESLSALQAASR